VNERTLASAPIDVGSELQRAREARGLALSEVAQQLKFAPRQLEALEQDRFDLLPGGTFVRGMVRNYARLLHIDPEPLVRRIADRFEAPDANNLAVRYSQPVPFSDSARRSTFVYLGLSVAVLALGAGVAYQWYHERGRPALMASAPALSKAQTRPAVKPAPPPAPPPRIAVPSRPKASEKVVEAKPPVAPQAQAEAAVEKVAISRPLPVAKVPPGVHRLVFRCDEDAWLEVRDANERALVSSLNRKGAERIVQARGPLNLVVGNARNVRLTDNDQPVDLGPFIKVETARFTLP